MEENKFEKQVRHKMEALEMHPSDTVWKKIEERIEKKKNRRWVFLILFLMGCCLLSGGYLLWNVRQQGLPENETTGKLNFEKDTIQTFTKENKTVRSKTNYANGSLNKKNKGNTVIKEKKNNSKNLTALSTVVKSNKKINSAINLPLKFFKNKHTIKFAAKTIATVSQSEKHEPENKNANDSLDSSYEKVTIDSSTKNHATDIIKKGNDTLKQNKTERVTAKQYRKNKWNVGISISGGTSNIKNDFFSSADKSSSEYLSSNPVGTNPGQVSQNLSSVTKSGFGFKAGLFAQRNISKKINLIVGVNFRSFHTSVELYDSAGTYSARSSINKYVNHNNFIEFPLSIKIKMSNGKNLSLFWQTGVTVSELISTNTLQLNPSTGYYYTNNSIFNKTHIGFNTALLASLFSKQKKPFLIGPCFYYAASKIANEGLYNKKHFAFTGLSAEIIFGK